MSSGDNTAKFSVAVTASTGVAFEETPVKEGVKAWSTCEHTLTNVPAELLCGTLMRHAAPGALGAGTSISVLCRGSSARLYVVVESSRQGNTPGRDGGLLEQLAASPRWIGGCFAPSWCGADSMMTTFSTPVPQNAPITIPELVSSDAVLLIVVVPVALGSFAVQVESNTGLQYGSMVAMEEGVVAWTDRDHRYSNIPTYLLGGMLVQGPHKDVPEGTAVTIRPNAAAKVCVILESSNNAGLYASLPAQGWKSEVGAPRWHDYTTMTTFSRQCVAGCAVVLPPTQGPQAVFSIVVVPTASGLVAPLEVSGLPDLDVVQMREGVAIWNDESHPFLKVPGWMLGATLLARGSHRGPPSGTVLGVRPAAPSVVYAIVEAELHGRPGRCGGLLADVFRAEGWERRDEAPEWKSGSALVVFAKRTPARVCVSLPPFTDDGAVFSLAVKVDVEAFDATVETSYGLEYDRAKMEEACIVWSDRPCVFTWVPTVATGGVLFRGPHCGTPVGTTIRIHATGAFRAYVIVEASYKGGQARSGGFPESLPQMGWTFVNSAPSWNDLASTMKTFTKAAPEGTVLELPPTTGPVVFSIAVVNVASSPQRLGEEVKMAFKAWDPEGKGAIAKEDLAQILRVLCPDMDSAQCESVLAQVDRRGSGRIDYSEFVDRVMLGGCT